MSAAKNVLYCAQQWIGYSRWDDPEPGTVFGRWYAELVGDSYFGESGVPYCAMFISYCLDWAGVTADGVPGAYVPWILSANSDAGRLVANEDAQPGDLVMFDWQGDGVADHIGIVEENHADEGWMQTIEGNTSPGSGGSQGNGGGVYRRARNYGSIIGVARPYYDAEESDTPVDVPDVSESDTSVDDQDASITQLEVDGYWGYNTTLRLQEYFDCPYKDGVISSQWADDSWRHAACTSFQHDYSGEGSTTIRRMQQQLGVTEDGLCGKNTINALIDHYMSSSGATVLDGQLDAGSITVKAMQRALNDGTF